MFSVIVFLNDFDSSKNIKKKAKKLFEQINKTKDIEYIFVVENKNIQLIDLFQEMEIKNKNANFKFSYYSKETSFNILMKNISRLISNDYFFIVSGFSIINNDFIKTISSIVEKNDVDVIEFRPFLDGFIEWEAADRLAKNKLNKLLKIRDNKDIIAYTFPFTYNKIFSTDLLAKTLKSHFSVKDFKDNSDYLFSSLLYFLFLNASTYWYIPASLSSFEIDEVHVKNFNDIFYQWNLIQNKCRENGDYVEEINYAKWFHLDIFMCALYSVKSIFDFKNNLPKKYYEKLQAIKEKEFNDFELKNLYMVSSENKNNEIELLRKINPISKWNKLLKELED